MNREDVIRMAREAGIGWDLIDQDEGQIWYISAESLERFAQAAYAAGAAAEREACAKVCEEEICGCCWDKDAQAAAEHLAVTIRARGEK